MLGTCKRCNNRLRISGNPTSHFRTCSHGECDTNTIKIMSITCNCGSSNKLLNSARHWWIPVETVASYPDHFLKISSTIQKPVWETESTILVQWHQNHMLWLHDQPTSTISEQMYVTMINCLVLYWCFVCTLASQMLQNSSYSFLFCCKWSTLYCHHMPAMHTIIVVNDLFGHPGFWEWDVTEPGITVGSVPHTVFQTATVIFRKWASYESIESNLAR